MEPETLDPGGAAVLGQCFELAEQRGNAREETQGWGGRDGAVPGIAVLLQGCDSRVQALTMDLPAACSDWGFKTSLRIDC